MSGTRYTPRDIETKDVPCSTRFSPLCILSLSLPISLSLSLSLSPLSLSADTSHDSHQIFFRTNGRTARTKSQKAKLRRLRLYVTEVPTAAAAAAAAAASLLPSFLPLLKAKTPPIRAHVTHSLALRVLSNIGWKLVVNSRWLFGSHIRPSRACRVSCFPLAGGEESGNGILDSRHCYWQLGECIWAWLDG